MAASNLANLKQAYRAWHDSKGASKEVWLELFAENVHLRSSGSAAAPLAFAQERHSKQEAVAYFAGLAKDWSMIHWTPETFVTEGDRIAVFATCAWSNKSTGKPVETIVAHLWTFENGKVTEVTELFDTARVMDAATP